MTELHILSEALEAVRLMSADAMKFYAREADGPSGPSWLQVLCRCETTQLEALMAFVQQPYMGTRRARGKTRLAACTMPSLVTVLSDGAVHSEQDLQHRLGISTSAVRVYVHRLRANGYQITTVREPDGLSGWTLLNSQPKDATGRSL